MNNIHPTAIVSSKAKLGDNNTILPYSIVEENVEIGDDCIIGPHAVLYKGARLGNRVRINQSASVAHTPQDLKFKDEETFFFVGDDTVIHEFVTLHRGTKDTGFSKVGSNCLIMAYSHVAHDCVVGNNCIIANAVQIAGHVEIEDYVVIGGLVGIHQFCKVGQHTMIGAEAKIVQDVPPFIVAAKEPLRFEGLNVIGLRRRGFASEDILIMKKAYSYIYSKSLNVSQAKEKVANELGDNKYVKEILEFLSKSTRGIVGK
ncbi:MAG: acyl-ACP--UDP-N-acetylglucosamine O-acyltransferase [Bacteroidetes bacterium]|nr:acyl-ACP--UDP-N-acetylglucosamine O-acyltransferase [Bacteroidota bacterium]